MDRPEPVTAAPDHSTRTLAIVVMTGDIAQMRYEARVTAYDMLESICVAIVIFETSDDPLAKPQVVLRTATTVPGEGESDPSRWARDALLAAVETL